MNEYINNINDKTTRLDAALAEQQESDTWYKDLALGAKHSFNKTLENPGETIGDVAIGMAQAPATLVRDVGDMLGYETPAADSIYNMLDKYQSGNSPVAHRIGRDAPELIFAPLKAIGTGMALKRSYDGIKFGNLSASKTAELKDIADTMAEAKTIANNGTVAAIPARKHRELNKALNSSSPGFGSAKEGYKTLMKDFDEAVASGKLDNIGDRKNLRITTHSTNNGNINVFQTKANTTSFRGVRGTYGAVNDYGIQHWAGMGKHTIPAVYDTSKMANISTKIPEKYRKLLGSDVSKVKKGELTVGDLFKGGNKSSLSGGIPMKLQDKNAKVLKDMGFIGTYYSKTAKHTPDEAIFFDNAHLKALYGNSKYDMTNPNIYKGIAGIGAAGLANAKMTDKDKK